MHDLRIGFSGGGNMAEAIITGLLAAGCFPDNISVYDRDAGRLEQLCSKTEAKALSSNCEAAAGDILILAVKPDVIQDVAEEIRECAGENLLIVSIAAGVKTSLIEKTVPSARVVRVMPNTPAMAGAGMSAVAAGSRASDADLEKVREIFSAVGSTVIVREEMLDAVTAVSGCGPAYVFQMIEAMADGAVRIGIPRAMAYELVIETVRGAAVLAASTGLHPGELKDRVTSPKGSTIEAIACMESKGLRGIYIDAVSTAYEKNRKLSE